MTIKWSLLYGVRPDLTEEEYKNVADDIQFYIISHSDRASFLGGPDHWGKTQVSNQESSYDKAYVTTMSFETDELAIREVSRYLNEREDIIGYYVMTEKGL